MGQEIDGETVARRYLYVEPTFTGNERLRRFRVAELGFVDGIAKDLLLGPPTLVRALGLRTIGRGPFKGEPI